MTTKTRAELITGYRKYFKQIRWQVIGTFTFPVRVDDQWANRAFRSFIGLFEYYQRAPICWLRADEKRLAEPSGCGLPPSGRHFHFVLASPAPLDAEAIERRWKLIIGNGAGVLADGSLTLSGYAKVRAYDPSGEDAVNAKGEPIGGLAYILKSLGDPDAQDCELMLSDNIGLFLPESEQQPPRNARERRALRRLMQTPRSLAARIRKRLTGWAAAPSNGDMPRV